MCLFAKVSAYEELTKGCREARHGLRRRRSRRPAERIAVVPLFARNTGRREHGPHCMRANGLFACAMDDWAGLELFGGAWLAPPAASDQPTIDRGSPVERAASEMAAKLAYPGRSSLRRNPRVGTGATRSPMCFGEPNVGTNPAGSVIACNTILEKDSGTKSDLDRF
ncbi:hypothetical protein CEXT_397751 [Caerostris extrusa]|uniref:Uncharacterized protein n=1 Tax=Caerostris extrusa TaxID=172846 RepID=A0AAV4XR76_CAEEX|nr:hypothetical protein CEXT_397751 [Caerostris extrusa]